MKKFLFLIFAFVIIGGTSYALFPGLFPDTASLPRVPVGDGSIGKIFTKLLGTADLSNYASDGTVVNTRTLSGVTASGYLKNNMSCPGTQKYIGIDADGKRLCGITNTLLTDYGTIVSQDCPADYYRIDDSQGTTATGDVLKAGDIVKTPPGCTMMIAFADLSILRLDGDTTISLDLGTLADGSTIASAILSNGSVWGRILTETGSYHVGTDVIVVGVRGTSIAVTSTGNNIMVTNTGSGWGITRIPSTNNTIVNLVDSRFSSGTTVHCINRTNHLTFALSELTRNEYYSINPLGCDDVLPTTTHLNKNLSFLWNTWIRNNTRYDIEYMYKIRSISGTLISVAKNDILRDEIKTTVPETTLTGVLTATGLLESTMLCESGFKWWSEREGCQENAILAMADFTHPIPAVAGIAPILIYGDPPIPLPSTFTGGATTPAPGEGISITSTGYVGYPVLPIITNIGTFAGKKIILETDAVPGGIKILVDFGGAKYAKTDGSCVITGGVCSVMDLSGGSRKKWKIEIIAGSPSDLKIGGNGLTNGITTRLKKITIE